MFTVARTTQSVKVKCLFVCLLVDSLGFLAMMLPASGPWLAGNEGVEQSMQTAIMCYLVNLVTTIRIPSSIFN